MSAGKAVASVIGAFVALGIIFGLLAWGFKWFDKGTEIVGPQNVEEQYGRINDYWQALVTTADNACIAQSSSLDENSPVFVENAGMAYIATYRNVRSDYNAAMNNIFKAGIVAPPGFPREIPNWTEATGADPDFCDVSVKLEALKTAAE